MPIVPFRFTRLKIAAGYVLLLGILLFSLLFVYREMGVLSAADDQQYLRTDSLLAMIHEKDKNTIRMLQALSEANDSLLSVSEIEEFISEQDSLVGQRRVQYRVVTKRDSLIAPPKKKGFFKRLAEAFVPSKRDSAVLVNTSLEVSSDTLIAPVAPKDSLQEKIRRVSKEKRLERRRIVRRTGTKYQRMNTELTARMDSLIKQYEEEMTLRARRDAELQQKVRKRSTRVIGGIAFGAVLLSVFFLTLILRDISRSNRYRRQLEAANKRAEDLLAAREKLMLAITHDFKAPLGSIMGYTDLLSRLTTDERQRFYLDNMKSSSEHLLKLVTDLLDFHRLDLHKAEVNRVSFHPCRLFEEIRTGFEPLTAAKGLSLQCEVVPELDGTFISDPLRIRQIVDNLLSNAVKFTSKGRVGIRTEYADSRLTIAVSDTGKGMPREDCERIFDEFTRLSGAQGAEGFGLGLSIVKKLVMLLEGTIRVESTPGEGSCFTVVLPLYPVGGTVEQRIEDISTRHRQEERPDGIADDAPLRILLIDDDRIQLNLTVSMLARRRMEAVCCEHPDELMEQLRQASFHLLLTDIQMPAIDGFDLLRLLRASNIPQARTLPVVAVTARSDMDEASLREHGFAACLHKPFSMDELMDVVHACGLNHGERGGSDTGVKDGLPIDTSSSYHFSALTAFSEDDPEAAREIMRTFVEETEKSAAAMEEALHQRDLDIISALSHKLLPLFTLIGAIDALPLLRQLEAARGTAFSEEIGRVTEEVLCRIRSVLEAANFSKRDMGICGNQVWRGSSD